MSRNSHRNKQRRHQRSIYNDLPFLKSELHLFAFGEWIRTRGGTPLNTTNDYEVARWCSADSTDIAIIYRNKHGELTWTLSSAADYRAFLAEHNVTQTQQPPLAPPV